VNISSGCFWQWSEDKSASIGQFSHLLTVSYDLVQTLVRPISDNKTYEPAKVNKSIYSALLNRDLKNQQNLSATFKQPYI